MLADGGQHLDLRRDVEGGRRLVEDQQLRLACHRHGDHGALQLAARDLMREALAERLRRRQVELGEQLGGAAARTRPIGSAVQHQGLRDLIAEARGRIEGGGRALGDIGDARSADRPQLGRGEAAKVLPVEHDASRRHGAARPDIAQGRQPQGGFAGARFADQPEHLAAREHEVDAVDQWPSTGRAGAPPRLDPQSFEGEQRVAHQSR